MHVQWNVNRVYSVQGGKLEGEGEGLKLGGKGYVYVMCANQSD